MVALAKHCGQERHIYNQSKHSSKNKTLPLPWWKWPNVTNLSPGNYLITLENSCHIRSSVLVSGAGRLGTWLWLQPDQPWWVEVHVDDPCINFIPDIGQWLDWLGKEADWHPQNDILSTWLLKSSSAESTLSFPFRETYLPTCSPDLLVINFPIMVLPSPWPSSQTSSHSPWIDVNPYL